MPGYVVWSVNNFHQRKTVEKVRFCEMLQLQSPQAKSVTITAMKCTKKLLKRKPFDNSRPRFIHSVNPYSTLGYDSHPTLGIPALPASLYRINFTASKLALPSGATTRGTVVARTVA
jgi:hypothetical protein